MRDKDRKETLDKRFGLKNEDWRYWECDFDAIIRSGIHFNADHVEYLQFLRVILRNAVLPGFIGTFELKWVKVSILL